METSVFSQEDTPMFRKYLKHITISGFLITLLVWLWQTHGHTPNPPAQVETQRNIYSKQQAQRKTNTFNRTRTRPSDTLKEAENSEFYRTIIDNNLFRPLGWRPPRPQEPYRLIGTLIPTDGRTGAQAFIQTTHGNTTYTVTRGDTLDADTTVIDIQAKQVTLEKSGQQRTLKLNPTPWLK